MGSGVSTANGGSAGAAPGGGELGTLCFPDIELDSWPGKVHGQTGLPSSFQLLLGHESLDFTDYNNVPIVQFPYQVVISWGYSPNSFRFSVPAKAIDSNTTLPPNESVSICVRTRYGMAQAIDRDIMKTVLKLMDDMKKRSTVTTDEFHILKMSIFVQNYPTPPVAEPEAEAVVEPVEPVEPVEAEAEAETEGNMGVDSADAPADPASAPAVAAAVVPPREHVLTTDELHEDWYTTVTQFSISRVFLAKQAVELIQLVGPLAPFERMDLAEMLYDRILNKESYQLVVNAFEDQGERDNLTHRLKVKGFSTDATLIC